MPNNESPELVDPQIIITKSKRKLEIFDGGCLIKNYEIVLGFSPTGKKETEGDGKTPEGEFYIVAKNPESKYHLSLSIGYPAADDATRGFGRGVITAEEYREITKALDAGKMPPQKTGLGGEIYIHGGGIDNDWTAGCIALKDKDIEEVFYVIPVGTKVTILC